MNPAIRDRARVSTTHLRRVVELARLAPSIHNTQPWSWRIREDEATDSIELWADRSRSLAVADPEGRNLMLSCGSALQHAEFAAHALGLSARTTRFPESAHADLLARIELTRAVVPPDAGDRLDTLHERRTDRRRFTSWPVPDERLRALAERALDRGVGAVTVTDASLRFHLELMLEEVRRNQARDPRYTTETTQWIDHDARDGIPAATLPQLTGEMGEHAHRFIDKQSPSVPARILESSDGLIVLTTEGDRPADRLLAGEALSALWLEASQGGLSVVPLSQLIEEPVARATLRRELHGVHPQILVRIGWQEISRSDVVRTPRRSLDEVLRPQSPTAGGAGTLDHHK